MKKEKQSELQIAKDRIAGLKQELREVKAEYSAKAEAVEQEFNDVLKYFDLAVADTRSDLRIMKSFGAIEQVFAPVEDIFENGAELTKMVYLTTKNTKEKEEGVREFEERTDLEDSVVEFVEGRREQKEIRIVGETPKGDIFLMIWKIVRKEKFFRHYFSIIPSNTIIKETKKKFALERKDINRKQREILDLVSDGVTILDRKSNIEYMNENAKRSFVTYASSLIKRANFEGRLFSEIFVTEDPEEVKRRLDLISRSMVTKKRQTFSSKVNDTSYTYDIHPILSKDRNAEGVVIYSRDDSFSLGFDDTGETQILKESLKNLQEDKKNLLERVHELETNHNWFMKNNRKYQELTKQLYSYLDGIPVPMSVQDLPGLKYQFVNYKFLEKFGKTKPEAVGKVDRDLFGPEDTLMFTQSVEETVISGETIDIHTEKLSAKQIAIYDSNSEPIYLIRVFLK